MVNETILWLHTLERLQKNLFFMCISIMCACTFLCLHTMCMSNVWGDQKRASDPLVLKLQRVD